MPVASSTSIATSTAWERAGSTTATSPGAAFILRGVAMPGDIIADPPPDALIGGKGRVWVLGPGLPPDERAGALLDKVLAAGQPVVAVKPIETGVSDPANPGEDGIRLAEAR